MKKIIILIGFCLFLVTGCYDYQELNDIDIVRDVGIDYIDKEYVVYLQIVSNEEKENNNKTSTYMVSGKANNIVEAFNKAFSSANKKVYTKHIELMLISENLANKGIGDVVNYLLNNFNNNYFWLLTDNIQNVFNKKINDQNITNQIVSIIDNKIGKKNIVDIDTIATCIINNKQDFTLPYIEINNDSIILEKIGYFNNNHLMGITNIKMYKLLVLDTNDEKFEYNGTTVNPYSKKISYEIIDDKILINVNLKGKIVLFDGNFDINSDKDMDDLEKNIELEIRKDIKNFLDNTLKEDVDILGLENKFYKINKNKKYHNNYEIFVNLDINRNGVLYEVIDD